MYLERRFIIGILISIAILLLSYLFGSILEFEQIPVTFTIISGLWVGLSTRNGLLYYRTLGIIATIAVCLGVIMFLAGPMLFK